MRALIPFVLLAPELASAGTVYFTHQGRLLTPSGTPIDGTHDVRLTLYSNAAGTTDVWRKVFDDVVFDDGYYTVAVTGNDDTSRDLDVASAASSALYLGVAVDAPYTDFASPQRLGTSLGGNGIPTSTTPNTVEGRVRYDPVLNKLFVHDGTGEQEVLVRNVPNANYFGTGGDGHVTFSTNTNFPVTAAVGPYDGEMVVKNFESLVINSGVTVSTSQPTRGLLVYVRGDATINGTLSMTGRGPARDATLPDSQGATVPAGGLKIARYTPTGTDSGASILSGAGAAGPAAEANQGALTANGTVWTFQRQGSSGGAARSGITLNGFNGVDGGIGQTGGGGGGGVHDSATSGAGSYGSCFGGGSGGGGARGAGYVGGTAAPWGGAGGFGYDLSNGRSVGGAGNPGGASSGSNPAAPNGTGGLLILIVKGNLNIGPAGSIQARGVNGASWTTATPEGGGGGSGGGNILVLYGGTYTNTGGTLSAAGGLGSQPMNTANGGNGGAGSVQGPFRILL